MLLTISQMKFLAKVSEEKDGKVIAKSGLSNEEVEELLEIDEANFLLYGEHLIENYNELGESE